MISIYNGEQTITLMSVEGFLEPSRNFWPAFITQENYQNLTKKEIFVKIYKLLSNLYVRKSSINQQSRNASAVMPKHLTLRINPPKRYRLIHTTKQCQTEWRQNTRIRDNRNTEAVKNGQNASVSSESASVKCSRLISTSFPRVDVPQTEHVNSGALSIDPLAISSGTRERLPARWKSKRRSKWR